MNFLWLKYIAIKVNMMQVSNIFAIFYTVRETYNTENAYALTYIRKNRRRMQQKHASHDICRLSCDKIIL